VTLLFVLAAGAFLRQQAQSQSQITAEDAASLRKYVHDRMAAEQIPAIAISVVRGDRVLWEEAFGLADRGRRIPATTHTPFYLASVTKSITGTAVMLLADEGKIDLDHPVNDYLDDAKVHSPMWNAAEATVRRVATHTSGLTTYNRKCAIQDANCEISTDIAIERYGVLFWPPGEHFDYSNLGYGILGELVSRVAGESYSDFLRDRIFRPLGMSDCFLATSNPSGRPIAAQYDSSSHLPTPIQASDTPGASSAHCGVHDLALFGMFALGERLPSQKRILSSAALQTMLNPTAAADDGRRYGFGWSTQPDHHGFNGLFAQGGTKDSFAVLQMIPSERIAVAVIANTGTTVPFEIVDKILSDLLPRYRESLASKQRSAQHSIAEPIPSDLLAGSWSGTLQTWKGSVPLAVEILPSHQVRAKWAENQWSPASDVSLTDTRFECVVHGRIGTPDAQSSSEIELELYLRKGILVGAGTTKGGVQLPYWVQLKPSPRMEINSSQ
jgi:CubicO group peptidase (beta-lactamase class C family)